MQFPVRCVGRMMGAMLAMTCALSIAALAGGAGFGDDDDNSEEEGPSYFGFVRDTNGATVPDANSLPSALAGHVLASGTLTGIRTS